MERASSPSVNAPQMAKNKLRLTGIQPVGRQRSGKVSSHVNGSLAMGCQSQPATFAAIGRLFSVVPQLKVSP